MYSDFTNIETFYNSILIDSKKYFRLLFWCVYKRSKKKKGKESGKVEKKGDEFSQN